MAYQEHQGEQNQELRECIKTQNGQTPDTIYKVCPITRIAECFLPYSQTANKRYTSGQNDHKKTAIEQCCLLQSYDLFNCRLFELVASDGLEDSEE
ncbi:hypothetical protein ED733_002966 [Metarhizium rileyi]|uniref:Uncharacterized protein n=1 Tax=Metarhizium rileyi (strain RCEF 4871) TaxID=1649241 RepID=A0A5C6G2J5_METRR|nr:hypothetical protein ED733_002966 [Metarhizium rileyi]